jgi:alkanesulfonate monooxygenase SsuD/methylene tetrahydromethanopterin reductase-like flavin-dependent oxidoreductase (luciferase family)
MQIYLFHLMPYADLDMTYAEKHRAAWVVLPNTYFDPEKGHQLYNRWLDELEYGEALGFDGLAVNEHHQNAYGLMPSPLVMASALSRRTKKAKLAILGSAFGLREHPLTVAEEHAMIDVITGGRLISGMVRGIGAEYYSFGANPANSLARYQEAHDLVVQAWTRPGPFAFEGKHYHFEYVNVWPRPFQQPHPPIWCPSQGSQETIEWAAHPDRKYVYLQTYSPIASVARYLNMYRDLARQMYGYTAKSDRIGWAAPVYIADTDEQAYEESAQHIEIFFNKLLSLPFEMLFPPGYLSMRSMKGILAHKQTINAKVKQTARHLIDSGVFVCGSPETVRRKLSEAHRMTGFQHFVALLQYATLPADLTKRNMERFAADIMPHLRTLEDDNFVGLQPQKQAAE